MQTQHIRVTEEFEGRTVAQVLRAVLSMSGRRISGLKRIENGILLNGKSVYMIEKVSAGDEIEVVIEDINETRKISPISLPIDIYYEDEYFMVVDKPAGISVHPTIDPDEVTLEHGIAAHLSIDMVSHPVSRLDRGTSGLMTIAKSGYVHELFKKMMHSDKFQKEYRGIIKGEIQPQEGTIEGAIQSTAESHFKREVNPNGKPSKTGYALEEYNGTHSLLRLIPYTGRTHQLRVHMSYIGHPLVGDFLYGEEEKDLITRPALHSAILDMVHPVTGKKIHLECPLPEDMKKLMEKIK